MLLVIQERHRTIPPNIVANVWTADDKVGIWHQGVQSQVGACSWGAIHMYCLFINICDLHTRERASMLSYHEIQQTNFGTAG